MNTTITPGARNILQRAADAVCAEPHRWVQHAHGVTINGQTCACALELIKRGGDFDAVRGRPLPPHHQAIAALARRLEPDGPGRKFQPAYIIVGWNDAEGRTPEEVAAALRDAAEAGEDRTR